MKKSFLALSVITLALSACTTNHGESIPSTVETTDANATWQSADNIQTAEMPSSMNQPVTTQPTYQSSQPIATTGSYGSQTDSVGNCQVVRDSNNAPIYAQIAKGCYTDSSYTVNKGDTLYLIGYLTGTNANQIATLNGLSETSPLKVGQVLRIR